MDYKIARGWLTKDEREFLKTTSERVSKSGHILNIGIEYGASIHCIRAGNQSAMLTAIDLVGRDKFEGEEHSVEWIKGDSGEIASDWMLPLDFIFIDGDHSYSGVMADIEFLPNLVTGGIVAFHDCYSWEDPGNPHKICPEVNHAVSNWFGDYGDYWQELKSVDSIRIFKKLGGL